MLRIVANYTNYAFTMNDLALIADLLTEGLTFIAFPLS